MDATFQLCAVLRADPLRWSLLKVVQDLDLPDSWIGAGFVRNAVWDHLHQRAPSPPASDVDVIWYDPRRADPGEDLRHEAALRAAEPSIAWSVKNQARMHGRNGDAPYASAVEAMRYWPETATAVAARRRGNDRCEIAAPFGLEDLLSLVLRPTPGFLGEKRRVYEELSMLLWISPKVLDEKSSSWLLLCGREEVLWPRLRWPAATGFQRGDGGCLI